MGLHAPGPWQLTSPRSPTFLSGALRARSVLQSHRVDVNSSLRVLKRERSSQLLVVFHGVEFVWESTSSEPTVSLHLRAFPLPSLGFGDHFSVVLRKSLLLVHVT